MNQQQILQTMSGKARLERALSLSDLIFNLMSKNIQETLGAKASSWNIKKELRKRLNRP